MELLQFAYFSRSHGAVIGVDPVEEMLIACQSNLLLAEEHNPWFSAQYIELRQGDALNLPLHDNSVDVAAQNCLFNIFSREDLRTALSEMYRVLRPNGRLLLSDPTCETKIPDTLRNDERLRAMCLTGAMPLQQYLDSITETGFGTVEIRARRPYRVLNPGNYDTSELIYLESVEICAMKTQVPEDGPCIFSGRTAIYFGDDESFSDGNGHTLRRNQPLSVCDKTARGLERLGRTDLLVTNSTYFYDGGGC
jgi:SAM-dependent methyltransferase